MRAALYARYSSNKQNEASCEDQLRECERAALQRGCTVVKRYADHATSGASMLGRSGIRELMRDAGARCFDVVFAESLDRLSRDQVDTPTICRDLAFADVTIVTLADGEITPLHIGWKGTMGALALKDLADKTRRGLRGRVEKGRSGGGLSYGYRVLPDGDRKIDDAEADVVRRIFREYAAGASPAAIVKRLNAEGVSGPSGGPWGPSTVHGHTSRGTGILNNEAYVGRNVWNRQRYVKNPATGKRVSRLNPPASWTVVAVAGWRIVSDDEWAAVKARQEQMRYAVRTGGNPNRAHRPVHLFSGLLKCGACGWGFVMGSKNGLVCSGRRERGICSNDLTIRRDEVEGRVLTALQDRFFESGPFEVFCQEFAAALQVATMEHRASVSSAQRELAQLEAKRKRLVESIIAGVPGEEVADEIRALAARREEIQRLLETVIAPAPALIHVPAMAELWRRQVTELRDALVEDRSDFAAREAVRRMVEEIRLTPRNGVLALDVKGNLAVMLGAADPTGEWQRQSTMVAGTGFEPATFGL